MGRGLAGVIDFFLILIQIENIFFLRAVFGSRGGGVGGGRGSAGELK